MLDEYLNMPGMNIKLFLHEYHWKEKGFTTLTAEANVFKLFPLYGPYKLEHSWHAFQALFNFCGSPLTRWQKKLECWLLPIFFSLA
jgi:hypothetical protein